MVAVEYFAVLLTTTLFLSCREVEGQREMHFSHSTALSSFGPTDVMYSHRGLTSRQAQDSNDFLKKLSSMVKDGTDIGNNLLTVTKWPLGVGLALHNAVISQIGTLITLFNFLVGFVTPGGMGASFLSWLRGDPAKMSRELPTASWTETPLSRFK